MTAVDAPVRYWARRSWLGAGFLNLFSGVGYLYVGRPQRAFIAAAVEVAASLVIYNGVGGVLLRPALAYSFFALSIGLKIFFVVDAARIARRSDDYFLKAYNKWWIYLGWWVVVVGIATAIALMNGDRFAAPAYSMRSGSMMPTLRVGDRFVADAHAYDNTAPKRGDLVVFRLPRDPDNSYIHRLVGLPGDQVQMIDGVLQINGKPVDRQRIDDYVGKDPFGKEFRIPRYSETLPDGATFETLDLDPAGFLDNTDVKAVPPGHYFFMGDNRDNASDSRVTPAKGGYGYIPRWSLLGKAAWIYWSPDLSRIGMRLD